MIVSDVAWQEQWKARVRALAHTWGPREFGEASPPRQTAAPRIRGIKTRLTRIDERPREDVGMPLVPPKLSLEEVRAPETGYDLSLPTSTVMIPTAQLLQVEVRPTEALISQAVRLFYERFHQLLPNVVRVGPLRYLAKTQDFYPVLCEDLGCYTIELQYDQWLRGDAIQCVNDFIGVEEIFYL